MIVVDLGCCTHGDDNSVEPLMAHYKPEILYGFDPLLDHDMDSTVDGTEIHIRKQAAWTHDGHLKLGVGASSLLDATVMHDKNDRHEWSRAMWVECFDFAAWLVRLDEPPVVKMNVEGAEFVLLEHLLQTGVIAWVDELVVAWHDDRLGDDYPLRRREIEETLECPVREWTLEFA